MIMKYCTLKDTLKCKMNLRSKKPATVLFYLPVYDEPPVPTGVECLLIRENNASPEMRLSLAEVLGEGYSCFLICIAEKRLGCCYSAIQAGLVKAAEKRKFKSVQMQNTCRT